MNKISSQTQMIKQQLHTGQVTDEKILDLFQKTARSDFTPDAHRAFAYSDMQIPLAHAQQMLTPLEEALILQALQLKGHETVLEIGTGSGFFTSLLSQLAKKVISVDYFVEFTQHAEKRCRAHGFTNIDFKTGDGHNGWFEHAPYDVIVLSGGMEQLSDVLKLQLSLGGKLFAIIGQQPVLTGYLFQVDHQNIWTQSMIFETDTPMLIDKNRHELFVF